MVTNVILQSVQQHIYSDGSKAWFMIFNVGSKFKIQAKQAKVAIKEFDLIKVATCIDEVNGKFIIYS